MKNHPAFRPITTPIQSACRWLAITSMVLTLPASTTACNIREDTLQQAGDFNLNETHTARTGHLLWTVGRSSAISAARNPVSTARLGLSVARHRTGRLVAPIIPQLNAESQWGELDLEEIFDREGLPEPILGTVKPLPGGELFFPRLKESIAAANDSIDIQVFIFDRDEFAVEFADLLKEASFRIPTRLLIDDLGTTLAMWTKSANDFPPGFTPPTRITRYLKKDSDISLRRIPSPWLRADHTKIFFTDGRAFIGGMNIGREYRNDWHDLMAELEGPVVDALRAHFNRAWALAGPGGDLALLRPWNPEFTIPTPEDAHPIRILRTTPSDPEIERAIHIAIARSRERIIVQTPYFASDDLASKLIDAAKRGVDVSVILPGHNDSAILGLNNIRTAETLIKADIKVFEYPGKLHSKAMLADSWVTMGSANMDLLSLRINRETNIAFSDPDAVKAFDDAVFQPDLKASTQLTLADLEDKPAQLLLRINKIIADQL